MPSLFPGKIKGIHYAWIILAGVMTLSALRSGLRLSFGVLIDPLMEQYGWSRGAISLAYTISFLSVAPMTFVIGWLGETMGARRIIMISALTVTAGMLLTGTVREPWQFQLYYGVIIGGLGTSAFNVLLPVVLTRWFSRRLGVAMGLMWSAVGFGPVVFSPVFRWAIDAVGWRLTFSAIGIASGLIILAASLFLRNRPQDIGLSAYGEATSVPVPGQARPTAPPPPAPTPLSTVRSSYSFWALIAIHFLGCVSHSMLLAHMVSMAIFKGIPGLAAAAMLSITSGVSIGSRFGMSMLSASKGGRTTLGLALLLQTAPIFILIWAESLWSFYLFAFLFGIGYGGEMVGFPIFNRQFYGVNAPLSTIYGYQMAGATLGMALGGWLGGALFDLTGSYTWTAIVAIAAGFGGLVPVLVLPRHRRSSESLLAS
jgi:cyanate permease